MISIAKDYSARPPTIDIRDASVRKRIFSKIEKKTKDSGMYRGYVDHPDSVVSRLFALYNYKCAFCESDMQSTESDLEVEHYRPARPHSPKQGEAEHQGVHHDGYPWLVYEWSNLLLACGTCNGRKNTQFPIAGKRVRQPLLDRVPSEEQLEEFRVDGHLYRLERPLLLNPEVDDLRDHFGFESDGTMVLLTERAVRTEALCRLNRRLLVAARKAVLDRFLDDLKLAAALVLKRRGEGMLPDRSAFERALEFAFRGLFETLDTTIDREASFTAFRRWVRESYQSLVTERLTPRVAMILNHAQTLYITRWKNS